jgi:hypothetical protein
LAGGGLSLAGGGLSLAGGGLTLAEGGLSLAGGGLTLAEGGLRDNDANFLGGPSMKKFASPQSTPDANYFWSSTSSPEKVCVTPVLT